MSGVPRLCRPYCGCRLQARVSASPRLSPAGRMEQRQTRAARATLFALENDLLQHCQGDAYEYQLFDFGLESAELEW